MSKAAKSFASLPAEHVKEQQETKHKADKEKKENVVDHVLFIDSQNRTEGVKGDLHKLQDLTPEAWKFTYPTIVASSELKTRFKEKNREMLGDSYDKPRLCANMRDFRESFEKSYPVFRNVPLHNLLIAGGSVGSIVRLKPRDDQKYRPRYRFADDDDDVPQDVDVFVHGLSTQNECNKRVTEFLRDLMMSLRNEKRIRKQIRDHLFQKYLHERFPHEDLLTDEKARVTKISSLKKPDLSAIRLQVKEAMKLVQFVWNGSEFVVNSDIVKQWLEPKGLHLYDPPQLKMIRTQDCLTIEYKRFRPDDGEEDLNHDVTVVGEHENDNRRMCFRKKLRKPRSNNNQRTYSGKIQLIFRSYQSISEILHGFDIGSSAVGYDGSQVWFSSLGRFAYEYGCNIVDVTRRSPTYEIRLVKYFSRGFHLILPHFDVSKLPSTNLKWGMNEAVELPFLPFALKSVSENRLVVDKFLGKVGSGVSDYQQLSQQKPGNEGQVIPPKHLLVSLNVKTLLKNETNFFFFCDQYQPKTIMLAKPYIDVELVQQFYDDSRTRIYRSGRLDLALLRNIVTVEKPETVVSEILSVAESKRKVSDVLRELFAKQRTVAVTAVQNMPSKFPVTWRVKSPGAQLTSSLHPVPCTIEEWYGSFVKKIPSQTMTAAHQTITPAIETTPHTMTTK